MIYGNSEQTTEENGIYVSSHRHGIYGEIKTMCIKFAIKGEVICEKYNNKCSKTTKQKFKQ